MYGFGLKTIILPKENEKDLADIPEEVREDLTIHTVDMIDEVLNIVLETRKTDEVLETPQLGQPTQLLQQIFLQRLSKTQ